MYTNSSRPESITDKFTSHVQMWEDYSIGVFLLILGIISVIGNGLSVVVFTGKRRSEENPAELFLLNIAVVNLILSVAAYPAVIISAFQHRWVFEELGCTIYGFICYSLGLTTILSLTTLAVVRYLIICNSEIGPKIDTSSSRLIILSVHLYSMLWAVAPLLGLEGYDVEPFGISCSLQWHPREAAGRIYIVCVAIFCFFIPTTVIILSHVAIYQHVGRARSLGISALGKRKTDVEQQLFTISWAVCAGFVIAWLPYAVFSLWSSYGDPFTLPVWTTPMPAMLAKSSIAYNPFIYALLTRTYRAEFKQAFLKVTRWETIIARQLERKEQLPLCVK